MTEPGELDSHRSERIEPIDHVEGSDQTPVQRRHLRRILIAFVIVVVFLPFTLLGDPWNIVVFPLLLVATFAVRETVLLRRSVREGR